MLDYGWGNPSSLILTADQTGPDPEPPVPVFDPYTQSFSTFINPEPHFHLPFLHPHFPTFYDGAAAYPHHQPPSGFMKTEPVVDFNSRIGLNLGGRTYFASSDDDFVNRLYRRSRMLDPASLNSPVCQAEGCNADLTHAKHYHRRHKVCEFHSKAATAVVAGLAQRFCQQCSRFHSLTEFDNGKRSCRKRLDDHNRRRRKSHQTNNNSNNNQESCRNKFQVQPKSPPDSGHHSSSVTVAISPPRISFGSYAGGPTSSSTSSTGYSLY